MANGMLFGVNGVARKGTALALGVSGVAREVKQGYLGVGGVARVFWGDGAAVSPTIVQVIIVTDSTLNSSNYIIADGMMMNAETKVIDVEAGAEFEVQCFGTAQFSGGTILPIRSYFVMDALVHVFRTSTNATLNFSAGGGEPGPGPGV